MAAVLNLAGAFIGTKVAHTIGSGIVHPDMVRGCQALTLAALGGAIVWNLLTWYLGLPSSSSHALIGGLMGAAVAYRGFGTLHYLSIAEKILLPLVLSPLAGFLAGYALMLGLSWAFHDASPRGVNHAFRKLQILSSAFMATSHGMNDAQKTMGIIAIVLFSGGYLGTTFYIPFWIVLMCNFTIALGTMAGGWRIVKTMGTRITKLRPIGGFSAETAAASSLIGATIFGIPVSTTHTITGAIMGVGATRRLSAVRWGVAGNILWAWILTIPVSALIAAVCFLFLDQIF